MKEKVYDKQFTARRTVNTPAMYAVHTHLIAGPVAKNTTGSLPLRNLQVITDSYRQTILASQNKSWRRGKQNQISRNKLTLIHNTALVFWFH